MTSARATGTTEASEAIEAPAPSRGKSQRSGLMQDSKRRVLGLVIAVVVLGFVSLASLALGSRSIPLGTAIGAFTSYDPENLEELIVHSVRGPRTLLGLMVGAALGLAGALMQGVTRNPLGDPGILGITAGAALAAAMAVQVLGVESITGYIWFAFVGAAVGAFLVYGIASQGFEGPTPVKLAIAGAAVTALCTSVTSLILLRDIETLDGLRYWLVGAISGRGGDIVSQVWAFVVFGALMALASGRLLNTLSLGDDVARSLGMRTGRARAFAALSIVILAGAATAAAGPIVFVGLVIPHIARAITGPDYRWILPYCAVLAPILVLSADILGRFIARPGEVHVGIVTALAGAPVFVALVRRRKLAEI